MNISERDLEDWICANPTQVVAGSVYVDRQVTLPHGRRVDVILRRVNDDGVTLFVVEVKAVQAGSDALEQVLDYVAELESCGHWLLAQDDCDGVGNDALRVFGILAAPSFHPSIARPAYAARVELIQLRATLLVEASRDRQHMSFGSSEDALSLMHRLLRPLGTGPKVVP